MEKPEIVSASEWQQARDDLLKVEKEATHALDALAAQRRRLPMATFDGKVLKAYPAIAKRPRDLL